MNDSELTLRVVCGLLASSARLVPVPFLDDLLREKAIHLVVSRTLKAHGRGYSSKRVAPLYSDQRGWLRGCLLFAIFFPIKLILFPIKKVITWVLAAKHVAVDLAESLLLGRALDRMLSEGRLAEGSDALGGEAQLLRTAFDNAVAGTDMTLMRSVLREAVASVSGLPRAALSALRRLRQKGDDADPTEGLSAADRGKVDEGARGIRRALETPKMRVVLDAFDARFDENLRVLESRANPV